MIWTFVVDLLLLVGRLLEEQIRLDSPLEENQTNTISLAVLLPITIVRVAVVIASESEFMRPNEGQLEWSIRITISTRVRRVS